MRRIVGDSIGVKASGGVRTTQDAKNMVDAGANRIGASSSISIVKSSSEPSSRGGRRTYGKKYERKALRKKRLSFSRVFNDREASRWKSGGLLVSVLKKGNEKELEKLKKEPKGKRVEVKKEKDKKKR